MHLYDLKDFTRNDIANVRNYLIEQRKLTVPGVWKAAMIDKWTNGDSSGGFELYKRLKSTEKLK